MEKCCRKLNKQDRQSTYNVTFRRVRATVVVVQMQRVLYILSAVYVALGIHYAMLMRRFICGLHRCNIFPYYLINDTIFKKKKTTL